jgi:hypothetical protein
MFAFFFVCEAEGPTFAVGLFSVCSSVVFLVAEFYTGFVLSAVGSVCGMKFQFLIL